MKQDLLSQFPVPMVVGMAMFLFLSVFIGAILWVYRKESTVIYSEIEKLPLEEGK